MIEPELTTPTPQPATPPVPEAEFEEASEPLLKSFIIRRYRPVYYLVWIFVLGLLLLVLAQSGTPALDTSSFMALQGKVISRTADTATTENNSTPIYTVTFEYDADPGKALSAQTLTWEVSPEFYNAHPEDSLITLYLDPAQPDRLILEPAADSTNTTRLLLGGGLLLLVLTVRLGLDITARRRYPVSPEAAP